MEARERNLAGFFVYLFLAGDPSPHRANSK